MPGSIAPCRGNRYQQTPEEAHMQPRRITHVAVRRLLLARPSPGIALAHSKDENAARPRDRADRSGEMMVVCSVSGIYSVLPSSIGPGALAQAARHITDEV